MVLANVPGKISEWVTTKRLSPRHRRAGEVGERHEVGCVERAAGGNHCALRYVRRVHAVEQQHDIDSREVPRLAENRSYGAVSGGKPNQGHAANARASPEDRGHLPCHSREERIEDDRIVEGAMVGARARTEIHHRGYDVTAEAGHRLLWEPGGAVEVDDQIEGVAGGKRR